MTHATSWARISASSHATSVSSSASSLRTPARRARAGTPRQRLPHMCATVPCLQGGGRRGCSVGVPQWPTQTHLISAAPPFTQMTRACSPDAPGAPCCPAAQLAEKPAACGVCGTQPWMCVCPVRACTWRARTRACTVSCSCHACCSGRVGTTASYLQLLQQRLQLQRAPQQMLLCTFTASSSSDCTRRGCIRQRLQHPLLSAAAEQRSHARHRHVFDHSAVAACCCRWWRRAVVARHLQPLQLQLVG
jgi:hypothetical protein